MIVVWPDTPEGRCDYIIMYFKSRHLSPAIESVTVYRLQQDANIRTPMWEMEGGEEADEWMQQAPEI
jgi:hypothetical protein